ncbi:MAG: hypothetical protein KDE27_17695 [Planctomycetes bacterium]|nr:hypothetical protein [Planctomycetota bacterium]
MTASRPEAGQPEPGQPARLTAACRAMLRGAVPAADHVAADHVDGCAFCRDWLRRRAHLQELLAEPVPPPSELRAAAMLDGVRERIVEACEEGPLGRVLARAMPVVGASPVGADWTGPELSPELAAGLRAVPIAAPEWRQVRSAVLAGSVGAGGSVGAALPRSSRSRWLVATGFAAALVLSVVLLRSRTSTPVVPEIDFADVGDLSTIGYSPMSILRNGGQK